MDDFEIEQMLFTNESDTITDLNLDDLDSFSSEVLLNGNFYTDNDVSLISFDNLASLGMESDVDLLSGDEEEIDKLIAKLEENGFENLDDLSYDQLLYLSNRIDVINDPNSILQIIYNQVGNIKSAVDNLATSKATLPLSDQGLDTKFIDKIRSTQVPVGLSDKIVNVIFTIIEQLLNEVDNNIENIENITVDTIYDYLSFNNKDINPSEIEDNQMIIFNYLESIVPDIIFRYNQNIKKNSSNSKHRSLLAKYLLADELALKKDLVSFGLYSDKLNIGYIKQLYQNENEFSFKCSDCGEIVPIGKVIASYIAFPTERGCFNHMFPKIFKCKCGKGYVFTETDYNLLESYLEKRLSSSVSMFVDRLANFCKGSANLRIKIPSNVISEVFSSILISIKSDTVENSNKKDKTFFNSELNISDSEFMVAVKQFYNKLSGMYNSTSRYNSGNLEASNIFDITPKDESYLMKVANNDYTYKTREKNNKLSYNEVAYYVCNMLSMNYVSVKNSAIFSLLFALDEHINIREYINCSRIWDLKNILRLLDNNANIKPDLIPLDVMAELVSLATFITKENFSGELNDTKFRKIVLNKLESHRSEIENEIKDFTEKREIILKSMINCKEALSFTVIYNMSQYKLKDFECILTDADIFALVDEISDRMIINYYAEKFFTVWSSMNIIDKNLMNSVLKTTSKSTDVQKSLTKNLGKLFLKHGVRIPEYVFSQYFHMTFQLSQNNLKPLKKLADAFNSGDYYRFCEIINNIDLDIDSMISKEYTDELKLFLCDAKQKVAPVLTKYKNRYEYYLNQFDSSELSMLDLESLDIKFSRYLPKKQEGESILNYIKRYEDMRKDGTLSKYNSIDYGEGFIDFCDSYILIYSCSLLYNVEYRSFATGTFMCQLLNLIVNYGDRTSKLPILGINESILNMLDNSIYVIDYERILQNNPEIKYRILSGYYFTSLMPIMSKLHQEYSYLFLNTSKSLNEKDSIFDLVSKIKDIINTDPEQFKTSQEDDNDYEDAISELALYAGKDNVFSQLLE